MIEPKGSWKGRIWAIFILWPCFGIGLMLDFFNYGSNDNILYQIGILIAWALWLIGLFYLFKNAKGTPGKKK